MAKTLEKILSENAGLTSDTQEQITEAWNEKLSEARKNIKAELREEFALKYDHDKGALTEAMDKFLTDRIRVELEEFAEDKKALVTEKVAYKTKLSEHVSMLDTFITGIVAKEVKELRADKVKTSESFVKLENFVLKQLAEEIGEFRSDKRRLVEQKVKMVREGKQHLARTKKEFIARASKIVEESIDRTLTGEIVQFRHDIKVARENEFGRRIYESFVSEFMTSYMNEGTEIAKLRRSINEKDVALEEANRDLESNNKIAGVLRTKLNIATDRLSRDKVLSELFAPLPKGKRIVMRDLLESVKTENLQQAFNKYLPAVLNDTNIAPSKSRFPVLKRNGTVLSEHSGNRTQKTAIRESADNEFASELADIKTLAGL